MTYPRVIPRDLFNEAMLLKCLGRLSILTERYAKVTFTETQGDESFIIEQDQSSGAIYCANVQLVIDGERCRLEHPLNSRGKWPLVLTYRGMIELDDPVEVFDSNGELTREMRAALFVDPWQVCDDCGQRRASDLPACPHCERPEQ